MITDLIVHNFNAGYCPSNVIDFSFGKAPFVLKTCQRTLIISLDFNGHLAANAEGWTHQHTSIDAYRYLLEIICGLKSKLVGENEIVGQFKEAYKNYVKLENRDNRLLTILEKLFKDSKEIRSQYLVGLCQKTYSSIARKYIVNKFAAEQVLILGSGALAEDLINQFKKKTEVFVTARNPEKLLQLSQKHSVKPVKWNDKKEWIQFPYMANSIGFDGILLDDDFFEQWSKLNSKRLFVDLGSPSAIRTSFDFQQGVMKLEDVFKEGAVHESYKRGQIQEARKALTNIAEKRERVFSEKMLKAQQLNATYV